MKLFTIIALAAAAAAAKPTVYFIRHGEKPDDDDANGLSTKGVARAQCLRQVFGHSSSYDIEHIMAQTPKSGKYRFPEHIHRQRHGPA